MDAAFGFSGGDQSVVVSGRQSVTVERAVSLQPPNGNTDLRSIPIFEHGNN